MIKSCRLNILYGKNKTHFRNEKQKTKYTKNDNFFDRMSATINSQTKLPHK